MQKWEYCVVGPIKELGGLPAGQYPKISYYTPEGRKGTQIKGDFGETEAIAKVVANLGCDGWEMVGCGSVNEATLHFIYFKRPIPA